MKLILGNILLVLMYAVTILPQNQFVTAKDSRFILQNKYFRFLGFNAYYLQTEASDSRRRYIVNDVFSFAKSLGVNVVRTWAFNNSDSLYPGVISSKPYEIREQGLAGLDYVVAKAAEHEIYLILALGNNSSDYGGIHQYTQWANQFLPPPGGSEFSHNHFFVEDSIINWYKFHINSILNRRNSITGILYKDDPAIFSFELMNEGSNEGYPSSIIKAWYEELSNYFRTIDSNHLLTTGEIGYDVSRKEYSNTNFFYNSADFLFNGSKGTSFTDNASLPRIDYSSIHSYPAAWNMNPKAGITWIKDHARISEELNKPILLGEFGVKSNKSSVYYEWLQEIKNTKSKSAVIWHYVHPDIINNDGYGFNQFNDPELINLFKNFINELNDDTLNTAVNIPSEIVLHQNYPNPFNPVTNIKYSLPNDDNVSLELYNSLGELIEVIDSGFKTKGEYLLTLSFNNSLISSGVYIYTLKTSGKMISKKLMLVK